MGVINDANGSIDGQAAALPFLWPSASSCCLLARHFAQTFLMLRVILCGGGCCDGWNV